MIIKSLSEYRGDLELRWVNGLYVCRKKDLQIGVLFLNHQTQQTFFKYLPYSMMPFLVPGLVISQGEVQPTRNTGVQGQFTLPDLAKADEIEVMKSIKRRHYDLGGNSGGKQLILRYQVKNNILLVPTFELIRFLFLHSRGLAETLLQPSGLMNLAVTPPPGLYPEIQIDFTEQVPTKLLQPEFIREFSWLSVHPEGRRAWDSVQKNSKNQQYLSISPPPLRNSHLEFRGVEYEGCWLVLEIHSLSGRVLPAKTISWTHPSVHVKVATKLGQGSHSQGNPPSEGRPKHKREHFVNDGEESRQNKNQDVVLLGGKRGCFDNSAKVIKVLRLRSGTSLTENPDNTKKPRKRRSDTGQPTNPKLPAAIIRKNVSAGPSAFIGGLPMVDFAMLEKAGEDKIGDLSLLNEILRLIEAKHSDLTLTRRLVFLKRGKAVSYCGTRRRACLVAVFTSSKRPPCALLDVDHTRLDGLSAILLRYNDCCPLYNIAQHVKMLLSAMVSNQGRWDKIAEANLPNFVSVIRLPKLLRMTDYANNVEYVQRWKDKLCKYIIGPIRLP